MRRARAVGVLRRVVRRRQLRKPGQQRHLRERELAEVGLSEVRRRRRVDAIRLVPVVDLVQVHLEDLVLAECARRLDGEDRLLDLPRERRLVTEEARLDELLSDRRAALADRATLRVRGERADDAADVDARVRPEGPVLDRDGRLLDLFRHRGEWDQVAPLVLERVQKVLARAVVDPRRQGDGERREVMRRREVSRDRGDRREEREAEDRAEPEHHRREPAGERPEASRYTSTSRCAVDAAGGNLVSVSVSGPLEEGHVTPLTHGDRR